MSDWQNLTPMGVPLNGATATGGGGNTLSGYRDILDARRSAAKPFTPEAEYPSGYLGNVNSRREDRLLQAVQSRLTQRNYQRGVHKGEKVSSQDYFWPDEFNPMSGIQAQAQGRKWGPVGSLPVEQINHMGKNHMLAPEQMSKVAADHNINEILPANPARQQQMLRLLPTWGR